MLIRKILSKLKVGKVFFEVVDELDKVVHIAENFVDALLNATKRMKDPVQVDTGGLPDCVLLEERPTPPPPA